MPLLRQRHCRHNNNHRWRLQVAGTHVSHEAQCQCTIPKLRSRQQPINAIVFLTPPRHRQLNKVINRLVGQPSPPTPRASRYHEYRQFATGRHACRQFAHHTHVIAGYYSHGFTLFTPRHANGCQIRQHTPNVSSQEYMPYVTTLLPHNSQASRRHYYAFSYNNNIGTYVTKYCRHIITTKKCPHCCSRVTPI